VVARSGMEFYRLGHPARACDSGCHRLGKKLTVTTGRAQLGRYLQLFSGQLGLLPRRGSGSALGYVGTLFGFGGIGSASVPEDGAGGLLIAVGCLALLALDWLEAQLFSRRAMRQLLRLDGLFLRAAFAATAVGLLLLPKAQGNPFIYFRF